MITYEEWIIAPVKHGNKDFRYLIYSNEYKNSSEYLKSFFYYVFINIFDIVYICKYILDFLL